MSGVFLAVLIVLNLRNGFGLANVGGNTQTGVIGAILIGSVLAQNLIEWLGVTGARGPMRATPAGMHLTPEPNACSRIMNRPPSRLQAATDIHRTPGGEP